ncbi:MAG: YcaO-related McrA-glycine thioamidation protein [Methanosarcinaceae archaeon]|nr:YcaO-related McrA-glycine thioamidation protein [Methanosarcinaceae archaeon]
MKLRPCKKIYQKETHRSKTLDDTYEKIKDLTSVAGITRVADITKLDRVGIPVFSCIRPDAAKGAVSVYNGKGKTKLAARVSAIMEGIERYSGEPEGKEYFHAKYSELNPELCVSPADLILPNMVRFDPEREVGWHIGYRFDPKTHECEEFLIPIEAVFHPLPENYGGIFRTNTNGLASGNSIEEAIYHGLAEVIERDAWSIAEASGYAGPVIQNIDDEDILELIDMFESEDIKIVLRDITSDIGLPTIAAVSDDLRLKDPTLLTIGMGTHSSKKIAAIRALTEVAQSRATQIHGAREDATTADFRKKIGYERTKRLNSKWFDESETVDYSSIKECAKDDFLDEILQVSEKLSAVGLNDILFANLTSDDTNIPVVKVVVPGAECYSVDRDRKGKRCKFSERNLRKRKNENA